ncbi:MAG: N-6 DNA methylase, partial [Campylobacteraceae bacterium]|nr:N-6 DNA methylase [Campylobacteraceae bacterium]
EGEFRKELIEQKNILEAVIGLPSGLFYGTGIPASLLIINKAKKDDKILFINADAEYKEGKNQNLLRAEDIEKINFVYQNRLELENYSKLVSLEDIKKENFNLNIRRYVDNTPPPTLHDVKAHLVGGVPKQEWSSELMSSYGVTHEMLFESKDEEYYNFLPSIKEKQNIRELLESSEAFRSTDERVNAKVSSWYDNYQNLVDDESSNIATLYTSGYELIERAFEASVVLDRFKVRGIFASWWVKNKFTIKSIKNSGYDFLLLSDGFISTNQEFIDSLGDTKKPLHAKLQELTKKLKNAKDENDKVIIREQILELKKQLFTRSEVLTSSKEQIITQLKLDAMNEANRYLSEKKQSIIKTLENLWDKYKVSLSEIEKERDEATSEIKEFLNELGYL